MNVDATRESAAKVLGCDYREVSVWTWPGSYSDTTRGCGGAGGQTITYGQGVGIQGPDGRMLRLVGVRWRPWDGRIEGPVSVAEGKA